MLTKELKEPLSGERSRAGEESPESLVCDHGAQS